MASVGVVGLGAMGGRIARRFMDAGHDVVVWNRTPEKARALADAGASVAETPADVVQRAEVSITMVADPDALRSVVDDAAQDRRIEEVAAGRHRRRGEVEAGTLNVLGEAVALADGLGLERDKALDVLTAGPIGPQVERRRNAIENDDYPRRFALALALKDADLVADAAASAHVDMRLASAAMTWLQDAIEAEWGDKDYSALLARILKSSRASESLS